MLALWLCPDAPKPSAFILFKEGCALVMSMRPSVDRSMWLIVLARGRTLLAAMLEDAPLPLLATEFFRTLLLLPEAAAPLTLSLLPARGREDAGLVMCNFCWWRSNRSRRAKHLVHSGHSKGFSFVCDRSCRFRCSSLANDLLQVPQTCGRGLSVLGGGNCATPLWGLGLSLLAATLSVGC
jgi:hypothetical protein